MNDNRCTAIIIGRFQPPHINHIYNLLSNVYLLRYFYRCKDVNVRVYIADFYRLDRKNNPIPLNVIYQSLEEILRKIKCQYNEKISFKDYKIDTIYVTNVKSYINMLLELIKDNRNIYLIQTADKSRFFTYKVFFGLIKALSKLLGHEKNFFVYYRENLLLENDIRGRYIRDCIRNRVDKYEKSLCYKNPFLSEEKVLTIIYFIYSSSQK